ncbi:glyoxalase/bleomycin resistance/extradiol dioxygenase family protein [Actinomadura vinacea]|uniref:Glyoxalase/bleomycin resistance/extradiol dioxygenase family protein n=1 Tax=Actinomadura vinacea TaxID=115336 RepID=A0ABN3JLI3_9ACTN
MHTTLTVLYTHRLEDCREFYQRLGLDLRPERHGSGPHHYAAVLKDDAVFELYPAGSREPTGRLRLGFSVDRSSAFPPGRHILHDPDDRTVELTVKGQ